MRNKRKTIYAKFYFKCSLYSTSIWLFIYYIINILTSKRAYKLIDIRIIAVLFILALLISYLMMIIAKIILKNPPILSLKRVAVFIFIISYWYIPFQMLLLINGKWNGIWGCLLPGLLFSILPITFLVFLNKKIKR